MSDYIGYFNTFVQFVIFVGLWIVSFGIITYLSFTSLLRFKLEPLWAQKLTILLDIGLLFNMAQIFYEDLHDAQRQESVWCRYHVIATMLCDPTPACASLLVLWRINPIRVLVITLLNILMYAAIPIGRALGAFFYHFINQFSWLHQIFILGMLAILPIFYLYIKAGYSISACWGLLHIGPAGSNHNHGDVSLNNPKKPALNDDPQNRNVARRNRLDDLPPVPRHRPVL